MNSESVDNKTILELVYRLQAQSAALVALLKETPAADGRQVLDFGRWERYEHFLAAELKKFNLE